MINYKKEASELVLYKSGVTKGQFNGERLVHVVAVYSVELPNGEVRELAFQVPIFGLVSRQDMVDGFYREIIEMWEKDEPFHDDRVGRFIRIVKRDEDIEDREIIPRTEW